MVYVHSKLMIVDDEQVILGSANFNEQSLNGNRDSECCVALWPDESVRRAAGAEMTEFRKELWSEHLGPSLLETHGDLDPGSLACVQEVGAGALANWGHFRDGTGDPAVTGHLVEWPRYHMTDLIDSPVHESDLKWSLRARRFSEEDKTDTPE